MQAEILLDVYREEDREPFVRWCDAERAFGFLRKSFPSAESPAQLFAKFAATSHSAPVGQHVWAVRTRDTKTLVGHLEFKKTDKSDPGEGELVLFVAPESRRQGHGREAIRQVLMNAHLQSAFNSALAVCRPSNEPSVRILAALGFDLLAGTSDSQATWFRRRVTRRATDARANGLDSSGASRPVDLSDGDS